jgi:hypothetical protein
MRERRPAAGGKRRGREEKREGRERERDWS